MRSTKPDGRPLRRVTGGDASKRIFSRLLGLHQQQGRDGGSPARVVGVSFIEDHFEVSLDEGGTTSVLIIERRRRGEDQRPFIKTAHVVLWYRGAALSEVLESTLRKSASRWSGLTVERMASAMSRDPELEPVNQVSENVDGGEERDEPLREAVRAADRAARSKGLVGVWDRETTFADFLAIDVFDLLPYESIEACNPFIRISHSDLECHRFMPREKASNVNVVDFPWIPSTPGRQPTIKALERTLSTDLVEDDVIMGCTPRVARLLEHLVDEGVECPIIFANTCLPATTAEDAISVVKRFRESLDVPILLDDRATSDFEQEVFAELFVTLTRGPEEARPRAPARDPRAINLVGFTRDEHLDALRDVLADLDLRVNAAVLPSLEPEELERLPLASLNVILRRTERWDHFIERLCPEGAVPSIAPPAPYGVEGTRRWLRAIVDALGSARGFDQVWVSRLSAVDAEWSALRAEARRRRVIVAGRALDIERCVNPVTTNGVPLFEVLEEMGFAIDVMIHERESDGVEQTLRGMFESPARHRVVTFEDQDELRQLLYRSEADAVVSNYAFDWRLTEAGKGRISLRHFEMGISGAVRTLRRLLDMCSTPFFKRYRRFFERDANGLLPRVVGREKES